MKSKGSKQLHYESGPNMTPLVDVVMVILIFLMLAGSFGGTSNFLVNRQPVKGGNSSHRPLEKGQVPDTPIEVRVDNSQDGLGFIASGLGLAPTTSVDEIRTWLISQRLKFNAVGKKTENLLVRISPSNSVKYQYLIDIYQATLQADYQKVAFASPH
jgi:biopolymer transport protein ExbD